MITSHGEEGFTLLEIPSHLLLFWFYDFLSCMKTTKTMVLHPNFYPRSRTGGWKFLSKKQNFNDPILGIAFDSGKNVA